MSGRARLAAVDEPPSVPTNAVDAERPWMLMANIERSRSWSRLRTSLEIVSSIAVIVTAGVVLWNITRGPAVGAPKGRELPIPTQPVSLASGATLGNPAATIAILEFSDFECPYCASFSLKVLPEVKAKFLDPGHVKFVFRHFPLPMHANAVSAAKAATCGSEQGRFMEFHDRLFAAPKAFDGGDRDVALRSLGIDIGKYDRCLSTTGESIVREDVRAAQALGITGTPTFMIGVVETDNQLRVSAAFAGAGSIRDFEKLLSKHLQELRR
jgi:protein-disulfide isomerase